MVDVPISIIPFKIPVNTVLLARTSLVKIIDFSNKSVSMAHDSHAFQTLIAIDFNFLFEGAPALTVGKFLVAYIVSFSPPTIQNLREYYLPTTSIFEKLIDISFSDSEVSLIGVVQLKSHNFWKPRRHILPLKNFADSSRCDILISPSRILFLTISIASFLFCNIFFQDYSKFRQNF